MSVAFVSNGDVSVGEGERSGGGLGDGLGGTLPYLLGETLSNMVEAALEEEE